MRRTPFYCAEPADIKSLRPNTGQLDVTTLSVHAKVQLLWSFTYLAKQYAQHPTISTSLASLGTIGAIRKKSPSIRGKPFSLKTCYTLNLYKNNGLISSTFVLAVGKLLFVITYLGL